MADFILHATLSNLIIASVLAVAAWVVQWKVRAASLANLLWALLLIKLVTPPLFSLPVLGIPSLAKQTTERSINSASPAPASTDLPAEADLLAFDNPPIIDGSDWSFSSLDWTFGQSALLAALIAWAAVSFFVLAISVRRIT
jgi:hypothetical protein